MRNNWQGNAVLWKPSDTAILSNWWIFKICREAGVPPGVVNFVPAHGPDFGDTITASPYLSGINFTGSVPTFNRLWSQVGKNIDKYKNYPKLIGECGGKNYHFVHPSADIESVVMGTIKSSFEFNGQKCSACSRMYVPESIWPKVRIISISQRFRQRVDFFFTHNIFASMGYLDQGRSAQNSRQTQNRGCQRLHSVHRSRYRRGRVQKNNWIH